MFELTLRVLSSTDERLVVGFGAGFRFGFAFLLAILVAGTFTAGSVAPVPVIIAVVLVLGLLYRETWIVDIADRSLTSLSGLLVLSRRRHWSFDEIEAIEFAQHSSGQIPGSGPPDIEGDTTVGGLRRGSRLARAMQRYYLRYSLVLNNGERVRIELKRVRSLEGDTEVPRAIAGALGVPLQQGYV